MHESYYTVQHLHDLFSELYGYEYDSPLNVGEDTAAADDKTGGDGVNVETENQEEDMEVDEEEASESVDEEAADESDEDYQDQEEDESEDMNDDEVDQDANKITIKPQKKKGFDLISAYSKRHSIDDIISDCKHYATDVDLSMGVTFAFSCDGVLRTGYIKTCEDEKLIAPYKWGNGKISRKSVLKPTGPNFYQKGPHQEGLAASSNIRGSAWSHGLHFSYYMPHRMSHDRLLQISTKVGLARHPSNQRVCYSLH
jgi:hypothetical protein